MFIDHHELHNKYYKKENKMDVVEEEAVRTLPHPLAQ
jgi:hypothetical protein